MDLTLVMGFQNSEGFNLLSFAKKPKKLLFLKPRTAKRGGNAVVEINV